MKANDKTSEILNDLIQINNDRVAGYEKAANETDIKDVDLRSLFSELAADSRRYANELGKYISITSEPAESTTFRGKIYRTWMDVKATFAGHDRKTILASCEFGEDAAQKAYDAALASDAKLPVEVRQLIMDQKTSLKKSHDRIKRMRDIQPA